MSTIVDSGTNSVVLVTSTHNAVLATYSSAANSAVFKSAFGVTAASFFAAGFGHCAHSALTVAQLNAALPPMVLTLGSGAAAVTLTVPFVPGVVWEDSAAPLALCSHLSDGGAGANGQNILGWQFMSSFLTARARMRWSIWF